MALINKENDAIDIDGTLCNIYEQDYTWKIENFKIEKSYCANLILPRDIEW